MFYFMLFFLIAGIINTIFLKFPQFKIFRNIKNSKNKRTKQAFLLGLATNLGVGNLIGVGAALYYGGPGVIFWMALFAFFASSFAYSETKYSILSQISINNETRSSTSLVIKKYLKHKFGLILSIVFAVFLIFTNSVFFPPIQVHSIVNTFSDSVRMFLGIVFFLLINVFGKRRAATCIVATGNDGLCVHLKLCIGSISAALTVFLTQKTHYLKLFVQKENSVYYQKGNSRNNIIVLRSFINRKKDIQLLLKRYLNAF